MTFPPLKSPLKFYAVVPTADWVERMVKAGADTVKLRCKTLHGDELKREIARCVAACQGSRTGNDDYKFVSPNDILYTLNINGLYPKG